MNLDRSQRALVALGEQLSAIGYTFTTPTPATHRLVNARTSNRLARSLTDIFGWSRAFAPHSLAPELAQLCQAAGVLAAGPSGLLHATVRWSTCAGRLFVHSAFPTDSRDAVFFGPDSYRFASFVARTIGQASRLADVGCGTGVGALAIADRLSSIVLADVNPMALRFAAVNAQLGNLGRRDVALVQSDVLAQVEGQCDAIIANPPYLADEQGRTYRDGGGTLGLGLCSRITEEALGRLTPGGQFVLYTGTPVVGGRPLVCDQLKPILTAGGGEWTWEMLDPDVFSEELTGPAYQDVEHIAVYGLVYRAL